MRRMLVGKYESVTTELLLTFLFGINCLPSLVTNMFSFGVIMGVSEDVLLYMVCNELRETTQES